MPSVTPIASVRVAPTLQRVARILASTVGAGAISGLVVGGIGGRVAMRVLALTSPEIAQGRLTDDAARVGEFTLGGSITLGVALAIIGALLSPAYLLVRRILPASRRGRAGGYALLTGTMGGALLVHDHPSFDYSILQPTWLAVTLFILIPALYGALLSYLAEATRGADQPPTGSAIGTLWRSRAVTLTGRTVYALAVAWGVYNIAADILSLASDHASSGPLLV